MAWFDDLELPGSTITGNFAFVHEDGTDADDYPDIRLASGRVRFEPTAKAVKAGGAWIGIAAVEAELFDGELVTSEDDPTPPRILSTEADTGVENWGWKATFDIAGASIKPVTFRAPTSGVHLTGDGLIPITGLPVEIIGKGAMDRLEEVESTVTAHTAALDGKVDTTDPRLTDARNPLAHEHAVADVTGLTARLAALEYDSGPRDIGALMGDKGAGSIYLRRAGSIVTLTIEKAEVTDAYNSGSTLFTLPTGFRRPRRWDGSVSTAASSSTVRSAYMFASGSFGIWAPSTSDSLRIDLTWITNDPPPTTLPGTPA